MRRSIAPLILALSACAVAEPDDADRVLLLRGLGDGRFADPRVLFHAPHRADDTGELPQPPEIVAGDFDGNGAADLAWVQPDSTELVVLLAEADGRFAMKTSVLPAPVSRLTSADFEPDGRSDLVAHRPVQHAVTLLRTHQDGTFTVVDEHLVYGLRSLSFADVDADHATDMITAAGGSSGTEIVVRLGDGAGRFTDPTVYDLFGTYRAAAAELNGDSAADLLLPTSPTGLSMMLNNGSGRLGEPRPVSDRFGKDCFHVADLDGDGLDDALGSPGASVLVNVGGGVLEQNGAYDPERPLPCGPVLDLDGDELPDFVRLDDLSLRVLMADGEGGFENTFVLDLNLTRWSEVTSWVGADVDANGHGDLVLHTRAIAEADDEEAP